jgi:hypothetical protein
MPVILSVEKRLRLPVTEPIWKRPKSTNFEASHSACNSAYMEAINLPVILPVQKGPKLRLIVPI